MSVPPQRFLSLPEEFVLLSYLPSGKVFGSGRARPVIGCAAAELGELALRRRLLVHSRKSKVFGVDVYRLHDVKIELLDATPTGLDWADALLAEVRRHCAASEHGRVGLHWWFRRYQRGFALHRDALAARGLLHPKPGGLFRGKRRHGPEHVARESLIAEMHAAASEQIRMDAHMLFLLELVQATRLTKELGVGLGVRQRLDVSRGIGAVEAFPEELRDTSAALSGAMPSRDDDYRRARV